MGRDLGESRAPREPMAGNGLAPLLNELGPRVDSLLDETSVVVSAPPGAQAFPRSPSPASSTSRTGGRPQVADDLLGVCLVSVVELDPSTQRGEGGVEADIEVGRGKRAELRQSPAEKYEIDGAAYRRADPNLWMRSRQSSNSCRAARGARDRRSALPARRSPPLRARVDNPWRFDRSGRRWPTRCVRSPQRRRGSSPRRTGTVDQRRRARAWGCAARPLT